jgi:hypothetical protein
MFSDPAHPWSNVRIADHSLTAQVAWVSMRTRASMNLHLSEVRQFLNPGKMAASVDFDQL